MTAHVFPKLFLALFVAGISFPVFAQVVPAARSGSGLALAAGAGVSDYAMDFGPGHEWGGTLWLDANLNTGPAFMQGLGIEFEARDLSLDRSSTLPNNMRTDTVGGGLKYSFRHFRKFRPYAKFLASYGSLDIYKYGYHWHWIDLAPGGGIDYRPFKAPLWVRVDYEYQDWPNIFQQNWNLDPHGVTLGAVYDFGHPHFHHK